MLLGESQFDRATALFFEAAAIPELLPKALQAVADACGAAGATLIPVGLGSAATIHSHGIDRYIEDFVAGGWETTNSRMRRGLELTRAGRRGLITDTDMFTPDELMRDRFYNEFVAPHRMGATAGMVLASSGGDAAIPISIERRAVDGAFQPSEVRIMNRYMARLKAAASLAVTVGFSTAQLIADRLASLPKDVALISGTGRILHMSPSFERHLGDPIFLRAGFLRSWNSDADRALAAAIRKAVHNATTVDRVVPPIFLPRRGRRTPLSAQVVPLVRSAQDIFMLARAAIIVGNSETPGGLVRGSPLESFGLTPAELRLAKRIGIGEDLAAIAEAEAITLATARSRLKAVMAKTDTHRQTELALLMAALTA